MHAFLSNLANRQTNKQTREKHAPPPLSEVTSVHGLYPMVKNMRIYTVISFDALPACDRQTDIRTDRQTRCSHV